MSESSVLVDVVKRVLRQRGITYAMVAKGIGLSEASVKRLFARRDMNLSRLEQVCALVPLELADLLEMTRDAEGRIHEMTREQEEALISEPKLVLVALLVVSHWTFDDILGKYKLDKAELTGLLTQLDRLKIIDLLPGNRIKVRLARNFNWRQGGPIQQFFEARVQSQFFHSSFLGSDELRVMVHGMVSTASNRLIQQRIKKLAEEFDALVEEDRKLGLDLRRGTTFVMAIRPWELDIFTELRRKSTDAATAPTPAPRPRARRGS